MGESYVYIGVPETDIGFAFDTATVPEPASLGMLLASAAFLLGRRRR